MPNTTSRMPASSGRTLSLYFLFAFVFVFLFVFVFEFVFVFVFTKVPLVETSSVSLKFATGAGSAENLWKSLKIFENLCPIIIIVWFQDYYHHTGNSNWKFFVFAMLLYEVSFDFISFVCSFHQGRALCKKTITPRRGYFSGLDLARGKGQALLFFFATKNLSYICLFSFNHLTIYNEDIPDLWEWELFLIYKMKI